MVEKKRQFLQNSRFLDATVLELNSKRKELVRTPRKPRLDSVFSTGTGVMKK